MESNPSPHCGNSAAGIPALNRHAKRLLILTGILFVLCVALRINGSSSSIWHYTSWADVRIRDSREGLLLSTPKGVRSDEWLVCTPAALSQASQSPSFPIANPSYGPGNVPLIMSLPARHYTMIFRPALWGYFALPFDYAFAWHWNLKIFGLFSSLFILLWTLSRGRFLLSLSGALSIQFSSFVQWWFSSPPMLPEMLTMWSLAVVASIHLFNTHSLRKRLLLAGLLTSSLASLFLCCYPPFAIPLFYLGACIVLGFVWQMQPGRHIRNIGIASIILSIVMTGIALLPWFFDCYETLKLVSGTIYPGQRRTYGGGLSLLLFVSGLFSFQLDEGNCPTLLKNICEASNFYPLWFIPLGLGLTGVIKLLSQKRQPLFVWLSERGLKVMLCVYLAGFILYAFCPLPEWFCNLTLLNRCTEYRSLLGIGIAGTILMLLSLNMRLSKQKTFWCLFVWLALIATVLLYPHPGMVKFLTPWTVVLTLLIALIAAGAYLLAPRFFLIAFPVSLLMKTALVNPVCIGLPEMLESTSLNRIRQIVKSDPTAEWAGYDSVFGTELMKACGAKVINGVRTTPDLPKLAQWDPEGRHLSAYNRYVYTILKLQHPNQPVQFQLNGDVFCLIGIHPLKTAESYPGLKYLLFTKPLKSPEEQGLELVESFPSNNIWIYRINRSLIAVRPASS